MNTFPPILLVFILYFEVFEKFSLEILNHWLLLNVFFTLPVVLHSPSCCWWQHQTRSWKFLDLSCSLKTSQYFAENLPLFGQLFVWKKILVEFWLFRNNKLWSTADWLKVREDPIGSKHVLHCKLARKYRIRNYLQWWKVFFSFKI